MGSSTRPEVCFFRGCASFQAKHRIRIVSNGASRRLSCMSASLNTCYLILRMFISMLDLLKTSDFNPELYGGQISTCLATEELDETSTS